MLQRVLTAEFIDGIKINEKEALEKEGFQLEDVSRKLVNTFAEQIFHTGFVHADPHPGNSTFFFLFVFLANNDILRLVTIKLN